MLDGQANRKRCAVAEAALHRHGPFVGASDVLDDREAEPDARAAAAAVGLVEALEHALLVAGLDADAGVTHSEREVGVFPLSADDYFPAFRRELDRVGDEVAERAVEAFSVAYEAQTVGGIVHEVQAGSFGLLCKTSGDARDELRRVERREVQRRRAGLDA